MYINESNQGWLLHVPSSIALFINNGVTLFTENSDNAIN